ncbi:MAG: PIN domain-containing protein [Verrucomicrobiota bacterium]|jgi:predicted nucleic acid-binding protein
MRIVFDTSVLVAAARSRHGASHALLSRLPDPRFQPAISIPVFVEYRAVLLRPENLLHRSAPQADGFLDFLLSVSHLQEIYFLWRPVLPDPDDDLLFELAVAANARYVVTHNLRDFRGMEKWGIRAVSPSDFLEQLKT